MFFLIKIKKSKKIIYINIEKKINKDIDMKIQIAGFDIEINEDGANLAIKVIDANGTELSNNSYTQSISTDDTIEDTDIPAVEETDIEETDIEETEETTDAEETTEETTEDDDIDFEDGDFEDEELGESFIPDFATFKNRKK